MTATRNKFFQAEQRQAARLQTKQKKAKGSDSESEESLERDEIGKLEPERKSAAEAMGFADEEPVKVPQEETKVETKRQPRLQLKKKGMQLAP